MSRMLDESGVGEAGAGEGGKGLGGVVRLASLLCECDDSLTSVTLMCFRFLFYAQLVLASFRFVLLRFLCNKDNKETGRQGERERGSKRNSLTILRQVDLQELSQRPLPASLLSPACCASSISSLCYFNFMLLLWHNENKIELTVKRLLTLLLCMCVCGCAGVCNGWQWRFYCPVTGYSNGP